MGKPVTDPELLALLNGTAPEPAKQSKVVTDPEILRQLESDDDLVPAPVQWARSLASGDAVANAPSLTGAQGMQALDEARRTRGQSPELRAVDSSTAQGALQFATNALGDVVGIAAAPVGLAVEGGVLGGKIAGKLAGGIAADAAGVAQRAGFDDVADWIVGTTAAKAIAKQQERGEYQTAKAAGDVASLGVETVKGLAFGASPPAFNAAQRYAETGSAAEAADAAWEAFKAYPVASVLPFSHAARAATQVGGTPAMVDGAPVQTVKGEPVPLNAAGRLAFEPITKAKEALGQPTGAVGQWAARKLAEAEVAVQPTIQRLAYDVVPNDIVKAQRAQALAVKAGREPSPAATEMATVVQRYNNLRDLETELSASQFADATPFEKFAAIEGALPESTVAYEAPVSLDGAAREAGQRLGQVLVASGMDETLAQQTVPFVLFEGVRSAQRGQLDDPTKAIAALEQQLSALSAADRAVEVSKLAQVVSQQMADPAFLAAADQAWSMPQGGYRWTPGSQVRQRDSYMAALKATRDADMAAGRKTFELDSPDLGQLSKDYTAALYSKLVDDVASTPDGRLRVMTALRSSPVARLQANPSAPPHIQALATWANGSPTRRNFVDAINKASLEIADNLGVDPVVIAKNYDRYLSRAFTEHLEAQAKLQESIGLLDAGMAFAVGWGRKQSGRYKRKLSQESSGNKLMDMVANGDLDLTAALQGTADQMIATSQQLHMLGKWHDELTANGMVSDKPRPGWVYTGDKKAAPAKDAASKNPYNFTYGKLADKYVHPQVAKQLGLAKAAMQKSWPIMQTWRLMHTAFNLPIYPWRNFVQDHGYIYAATGLAPTHGLGRKLRLESASDLDRYVKAKANGQPGVVSPMMLEAIEQGAVDPSQTVADLQQLPPSLRAGVAQQAAQLAGTALKQSDPADAMRFVAEGALALRASGKMVKELGASALRATEAARVTPELRNKPSAWLSKFNDELSRSTVVTMMAMAEQSRRLYAYRVAREHMKLPPERAALFAQHAVYGVEAPDLQLDKAMKSPVGQILLPPFLRFGAWQAKNSAQRVFNDPNLYAAWMLTQGMSATNDEDILRQEGRGPFQARMAQAYLQRNSAPDIGLGSAKDVADVVRPFAPRLADNLARRDTFLDLSLRDVGGYTSFLSNIDPSLSGLAALVQFNPLARYVATVTDDQLTDPITGIPMLPEADPSFSRKAVKHAELVAASLFPQWLFTGVKDAAKAVQSVVTDKPIVTSKTGQQANVANISKLVLGPLAMTPLDQIALASQLSRRLKAKQRETSESAAKYTRTIPLDIPPDTRAARATAQQVNAQAKLKQLELAVALAYGADPAEVRIARQRIEKIRQEAEARTKQGGDVVSVLSQWWNDSSISKLISPVQEAIDDILEDRDDDDEQGADPSQ